MLPYLFIPPVRRISFWCVCLLVLLPFFPPSPVPGAPMSVPERNFQTGLEALKNEDYRVGFEILSPLAKQGDRRAQYCIGLLYAQGKYLPLDFTRAREWYRLAAEQGHINAQNNLGLLFKQGKGGAQDMVRAYMWFDIAAENGNINALRNRENAKEFLAPDQLAFAQNLATSWHPGQYHAPAPDIPLVQESPPPAETQSDHTVSDGQTIEQLVTSRTLRVALPSLPESADPQKTSANASLAVNIYDRLVEYETHPDGSTSVIPGLAEKWKITDNGKSYIFTLRENARFHNGDTVTAQDVAFTFKRLLTPATGSYNARLFKIIKSVSANGNRTVRIALRAPYAPLLALLATPWASILNKSFTIPLGNAYGRSPATTCGSGPFILARLSVRKGAFLSANQNYYRGPAQIDGVFIRLQDRTRKLKQLLTDGQLDVLDTDSAPELLPYFRNFASWKKRIVSVRRLALLFVTLNQKLVPFNNLKVRQAFLHAVDRKRLLALLSRDQGQLVNGVLPHGMLCTPSDLPELSYDPQRSRDLLQQSGVQSAELTLLQVNQWSELMARLNVRIKEMAEQAGFSVRIVSLDESDFFELRNSGKAPSYVQLWEADFNDPDTFFSPFFTPPGTRKNSLNFADKQAIRQIQQARTRSEPDARCSAYRELERRIVDKDAAWLPLFSRTHAFILGPRVETLPQAWNGGSYIPYYTTRLKKSSENGRAGTHSQAAPAGSM